MMPLHKGKKGGPTGWSPWLLVGSVAGAIVIAAPARAATDVRAVYELLNDWQLEDALAEAQALFAQAPDDPEVWIMAAHVQHQRGEHLSALSLLDAAARADETINAGYRSLVETSARLQANAESVMTPHFEIRYLNKDEIVAYYAGPILEAAYSNIGGDLDLLAAERGERILVEIYPDARGLAGATGLTVKEIETSGTIAVCKFHRLMITSPLATLNGYDWGDTLAHEFVHLLISKKSHDTIPIWLHEGIAKFYESRWKGKAGEALNPYSEKLLADAVRKNDFITYQQMHPSMALLPSQEAAALAFAEVFTTIEYLRKQFGNETIPELLVKSAERVPLEQALHDVFGMGLGTIETSWKRYLKKRPFREIAGAAPRKIRLIGNEDEAIKENPLETIDDPAVHKFARLGELLQLRGKHRAAVVEYEKAYARAGAAHATLLNRLARAYIETDRLDDAVHLVDKALAAHPNDGDAHLLAGRIRLAQNQPAKARAHFEAVRRQNPFNPEVHAALAKLYEQAGDKEAAAKATHFLELARKPRPSKDYELPSPPAGNAFVSLLSPNWGQVRINGATPIATPAWRVPVEAGELAVEILSGPSSGTLQTVMVKPGESTTMVLH
ncbi:MAG: hypothetical protein A2341_00170 [Deltaproteobacteria bacterium RIFOXYB12_FULL_58_9]|nr:MAG: hypothetical protein A2341_00170 [Deltaproteobacteria bacterium RIFOXYB12_FULL_58_9]